jgi:uncharacterized protein DUF4166
MKPSPAIARRESAPDETLGDLRFRALLSDADWAALPLSVRRRFSRRVPAGRAVVYVGEILETRISRLGWLLVQAARLIGAPFPLCRDAHVPSVVSVTEDAASGGQHWTMLYARRRRFPQIVHSLKRFGGPTGLEDRVRHGVGVTLIMGVEDDALVFRSRDYFVELWGMRFWLPSRLTPGALTVTHAECADDRFSFMLEVTHPRFGLLIRQMGLFREARA